MRRALVVLCCVVLHSVTLEAAVQSSRTFDGANDEVDWGNNVGITTNDASVCIWVNPTEDASTDVWLSKKSSGGGNSGYQVSQNNTDQHFCELDDGTTTQGATSGSDRDAVWTFVCCVWDSTGDDLTLYENAISAGSDTTGTPSVWSDRRS